MATALKAIAIAIAIVAARRARVTTELRVGPFDVGWQ